VAPVKQKAASGNRGRGRGSLHGARLRPAKGQAGSSSGSWRGALAAGCWGGSEGPRRRREGEGEERRLLGRANRAVPRMQAWGWVCGEEGGAWGLEGQSGWGRLFEAASGGMGGCGRGLGGSARGEARSKMN